MLEKTLPLKTVTLTATVETDLISPEGMDVRDLDRAEFAIQNTGANPATIKVYYSPGGKLFSVDATTYTATAGAITRVPILNITGTFMRVTATSASGTSVNVEGFAKRGF